MRLPLVCRASRRITDEEFNISAIGGCPSIVTERGGVAAILARDDLHANAFAPSLQLLDRGSAKGVRGHEEVGVAVFFEPVSHFRGRSGLSGAVDANQ